MTNNGAVIISPQPKALAHVYSITEANKSRRTIWNNFISGISAAVCTAMNDWRLTGVSRSEIIIQMYIYIDL